jgi:hypothetical protein
MRGAPGGIQAGVAGASVVSLGGAKGKPEDAEMRSARRVIRMCGDLESIV